MTASEKLWVKNWTTETPNPLSYPNVPLFDLLRESAKRYPEKPAVVYLDKEISYGELDHLSDRFAVALSNLGVQKGDRAAIFLPNIPQFVIVYYGILKAGAVITAISPLHREREVEYQLIDSEAQTIITIDDLLPIVESVWQKTKLRKAIVTAADEYSNALSIQKPQQKSNIHHLQQLINQDNAEPPKVKIEPTEDLAALQYTGGTTGTAKGAMLTHANLVSNAVAFATWIKSSADETFLAALPLFHIYGMTTSLNAPISISAKIVLVPKFDPANILSTIQKQRAAVFCGSPIMYQALLANSDLTKYDLTSIRVCISGASPLPQQVQKSFMDVAGGLLAEGYGLTEASPVTHCNPVGESLRTVRTGSIGLPISGTEAKIVDVETGTKTLSVGETGELAVRGPQVMKGYWHRQEETVQVLRGGWLLTGDIAHVDAEGYFYITDRKKDLIKYKDYSVYPREIEDVLYEHPAVRFCTVVGKPDAMAGEIPKAFIVPKEGVKVSVQEIMAFVNDKVAPYKAIREVEFRKELPLSSAGKVLKRALRENLVI